MSIVTSPTPLFQNFPVDSDFYSPSFFNIASLTLGKTTTIETAAPNPYVLGQIVRVQIPSRFGTIEINLKEGVIIQINSNTEFIINLDSSQFTPFIASPYTATITNITQSFPALITASNSFYPGDFVEITDVEGMTEINNNSYQIISANSTQFELNVDSSNFSAYSANGTATLNRTQIEAKVFPIGDLNNGAINTENQGQQTFIDGSFINISPQ